MHWGWSFGGTGTSESEACICQMIEGGFWYVQLFACIWVSSPFQKVIVWLNFVSKRTSLCPSGNISMIKSFFNYTLAGWHVFSYDYLSNIIMLFIQCQSFVIGVLCKNMEKVYWVLWMMLFKYKLITDILQSWSTVLQLLIAEITVDCLLISMISFALMH